MEYNQPANIGLSMIRIFSAMVLILVLAGVAVAGTDAMCVSDCITLKNPKEFCVSQCSYKDNTKQSQIQNPDRQTPKAPKDNA